MVTLELTEAQLAKIINEPKKEYRKSISISSNDEAYEQIKHYGGLDKEHFILLTLDGANNLINLHEISVGTATASLVHPREVFKPAIIDGAVTIIVAHNHPSGNLNPSQADREVTERLKEVGEIIGIQLVDHIIVTKGGKQSII